MDRDDIYTLNVKEAIKVFEFEFEFEFEDFKPRCLQMHLLNENV